MASSVERFQAARRDRTLVVIEGFHALKHAIRFGADVDELVTSDPEGLDALAHELAPDIASTLASHAVVSVGTLAQMAPRAPRTAVMAIARRPIIDAADVLAAPGEGLIVLLEAPRTLGNVGACIRVAAAAGAGGVIVTGPADPWHPEAVRGAAGLQFALPVAHGSALPTVDGRTLVAVDPGGEPMTPARVPSRAVLAFGTERDGLSDAVLASADIRLRIPMAAGVSSLNLATAVAATLFALPASAARR